MALRIIGEHPLARRPDGRLVSRVATLFLRDRLLITLPGIHATQRLAYVQTVNADRREAGLAPLSAQEEQHAWENSVDLIAENGHLLIRPDPARMDLALEADEALQELISKRRIRFLNILDERVRQAVTEKGELWRISPLPQSVDEIKAMIGRSRIAIAQRPIYYYNMITGQRFVTFEEFDRLGALDAEALRRQLEEIRDYAQRPNRRGYPEVSFFMTDGSFGPRDLAAGDPAAADEAALRRLYEQWRDRFRAAVPPPFRRDDPDAAPWRCAMFSALVSRRDEPVSEEILRGLSPEFFLQIRWLAGGRIERGEILFDPVFEEFEARPDDPELRALCDPNAKRLFFNFIREFGDVEYLNIGRVVTSLSSRPSASGRRDVYIAEIKLSGVPRPLVRIIRFLKWGIREHLEEQKDLLRSIIEAEEYAEYILDRRLGCRQLGMNLPSRITMHKIAERYHGSRKEFEGQLLWATYAERDYIRGIATDKLPAARLAAPEFAVRFAALLGEAAAPSIIVGRLHLNGTVLFDDGDEVLLEDEQGLPAAIVVADHTGTFSDYQTELTAFAEGYAGPVNRRLALVPDPAAFVEAYLAGFRQRFADVQDEFRRRRRAFVTLFRHGQYAQEGAFAYRWERVLERLDRTDVDRLVEAVRRQIRWPS